MHRFLSSAVWLVTAQAALATVIPAEPAYVRSLNGQWRFSIEAAGTATSPLPEFAAPDFHEDVRWHDITVPGNWEMAGFSPATYNNDGPNALSGCIA